MSCDNMKFDRNLRRTDKLLFIIKKTIGCRSGKKTGPNSGPVQILARNLGSGTTLPISI